MMQWLLDCGGSDEPTNQPALPSARNPRRADPVELELLFKFHDGFAARVPPQVRSEYAAAV